jgi:hypothetical protein
MKKRIIKAQPSPSNKKYHLPADIKIIIANYLLSAIKKINI